MELASEAQRTSPAEASRLPTRAKAPTPHAAFLLTSTTNYAWHPSHLTSFQRREQEGPISTTGVSTYEDC